MDQDAKKWLGHNDWDEEDDEQRRLKLRGIYAYGVPGLAHISDEQFGEQAKADDEGGDVSENAAGVDSGGDGAVS